MSLFQIPILILFYFQIHQRKTSDRSEHRSTICLPTWSSWRSRPRATQSKDSSVWFHPLNCHRSSTGIRIAGNPWHLVSVGHLANDSRHSGPCRRHQPRVTVQENSSAEDHLLQRSHQTCSSQVVGQLQVGSSGSPDGQPEVCQGQANDQQQSSSVPQGW